jgi:transposase
MSKKIFTEQEIEILSQNKYVKRVGPKGITYTEEMKHLAISKMEKGLMSTEIFEKAGFDLTILGYDRVWSSLKRWKRAYQKSGVMGLQDTRQGKSGRPLERELSLEEQLERERAKNKFLEFQLEFQKKLDMIERGVYTPKSKRKQK